MPESVPDQILAASIRVVRAKATYRRTGKARDMFAHRTALGGLRKMLPSLNDRDADVVAAVTVDLAGTALKHLLGMKIPKVVERATTRPPPGLKSSVNPKK